MYCLFLDASCEDHAKIFTKLAQMAMDLKMDLERDAGNWQWQLLPKIVPGIMVQDSAGFVYFLNSLFRGKELWMYKKEDAYLHK